MSTHTALLTSDKIGANPFVRRIEWTKNFWANRNSVFIKAIDEIFLANRNSVII